MGGIIIYIGDSKPHPDFINNESSPLRTPLEEAFKGVPELVGATFRYVNI